MNKKVLVLLVIVWCSVLSSCQRDDLCVPDELDFPRLVVVFVDARNQLVRKPVETLEVLEINDSILLPLNATGATRLTQVDSIAIPLRIDQSITQLEFIQRLSTNAVNRSPVDVNYIQEEQYVNRACGFIPEFNNLSLDRPDNPAMDEWITNFIIRTPDVTSNQDIHVEIRH